MFIFAAFIGFNAALSANILLTNETPLRSGAVLFLREHTDEPSGTEAIYIFAMAERISKRAYHKKYAEQHGRCFYCADELPEKFEVDHILPFSVSRNGTVRNKCLCCIPCNRMKAARSIDNFRAVFETRCPGKLIRGLFYFEFLKLWNNG